MTARLLALLVATALLGFQPASAQVFCEFGRHYVLAAPAATRTSTRPNVLVGATFSYSLDNQNQWALGADVTYPVSRAFALAGGVAYCDPRLGLDPKPMLGVNVSWRSSLSADNAWGVAVQIGTSYIAIDLSPLFPSSGKQKEVTVPGLVALEHTRGLLRLWAGGIVQYSRSWTSVQTIRSATDPGGALGVDVQLSAAVVAGAAYNFLWIEDPSGNAGVLDGLVLRLGFAL
jgi:hypothetical protein